MAGRGREEGLGNVPATAVTQRTAQRARRRTHATNAHETDRHETNEDKWKRPPTRKKDKRQREP
eukprot:4435081-Prymnesium_polylepis.1